MPSVEITQAAPKKNIFMSSRIWLPLSAVLVLISGFAVYYIVIISRQEAAVDHRALRSLAALSGQFKDLVNTYGDVLKGATKQAWNEPAAGVTPGAEGKKDILGFLAAQGSALGDVDECAASPYKEILQARKPTPDPWILADVAVRDTGYNLELASNGQCAHVPFAQALGPLLETPNQIFDEVVLTDSAGNVLFQTQRAGIVADNLRFLAWRMQSAGSGAGQSASGEGGKKSQTAGTIRPISGSAPPESSAVTSDFSAASESSNVVGVALGGTEYRAYLVPARLAVPSPALGIIGARFVLCGLIRQDNFRADSRSLPMSMLTAILLAVCLVIVAAWPMLKFATMRRTEFITRRAGLNYVLFSAATIMVMILFVIHANYGFSDPKTNNNLADLARAIDRNIGGELKGVLRMMEAVRESSLLKKAELKPYPTKLPCSSRPKHDPVVESNLLSKVGMQVAEYPYFRRLFVYDSQGFELLQWTVDAKGPPPLRVCERPYFQGIMREDLWHLSDEDLSGQRFRVDPIYSKSTGQYLAAVARKFQIRGEPADPGVMMLVTSLLSLIRPVLPPDYGFAVIDPGGKVLFHSDSAKNGRENFFDESGDSKALRAAVIARRPNRLWLDYLGARHELFVTPFTTIQHCPWSLIVFSSRSSLGDKQLERIVLLAILVSMYFVLLAVFILVLRARIPCYVLTWPRENMKGAYIHIGLVILAVILNFYALIFQATPKEVVWLAVLIPLVSVAFVILRLKSRFGVIVRTAVILGVLGLLTLAWSGLTENDVWHLRNGPLYLPTSLICAAYFSLGFKSIADYCARWNKCSLRTAYSTGCFGLLLLVAGLPCIAFFKLAFDYDENLATRRQQLLTMNALAKREKQAISEYLNVQVSAEDQPLAGDLGKWLFLRRRLQVQNFDVYDKAFRDQRRGQIFSSSRPGGEPTQDDSRWPGWLVWLASNGVPHRAGSLAEHVAGKSPDGSQWTWEELGANRIQIHPSYQQSGMREAEGSPETTALAKLALRDPMFLVPNLIYDVDVLRPWEFLRSIIMILVPLLVCMLWSMRSTIVKIFLLDKTEKTPELWGSITLEAAVTGNRNSVLVGLPCSGKTEWLLNNAREKRFSYLNVAAQPEGGVTGRDPAERVVVIDHFEHRMNDHAANMRKLALLENLLFEENGQEKKNRNIIIVTTVDPKFYFESATEELPGLSEGALNREDMERWNRVLRRFELQRLVGQSTTAPGHFCYQFVWSTCTWSEKIALFPLADEGWANHKNYTALEHLRNRGLVKLDPGGIIDEDFRKHISGCSSPQERKTLEHQDRSGLWDGLRTLLIVALLGGLAAILFLNQNDILGYFISGISALTAATRIIAEVRGSRSGAGKGGAQAA